MKERDNIYGMNTLCILQSARYAKGKGYYMTKLWAARFYMKVIIPTWPTLLRHGYFHDLLITASRYRYDKGDYDHGQ